MPTPPPVLRPDAEVPAYLGEVVVVPALSSAYHFGAADKQHQNAEELDALLRELIDRGADQWIVQRVDELAQQFIDAGDEHAHAAEERLDVMAWLATDEHLSGASWVTRPTPDIPLAGKHLRLVTVDGSPHAPSEPVTGRTGVSTPEESI